MYLRNHVVRIFGVVLFLAACTPAATTQPQALREPATPTPEVFQSLDPSPTVSNNTLPLTCQFTDLSVYVNQDWGYCFAYPTNYMLDESQAAEGRISLYGRPLGDPAEPIRVTLEVTVQTVPAGSSLPTLANSYRLAFLQADVSTPTVSTSSTLGGEPAETLESVPGRLPSRLLMALHDNMLYTLRFFPSETEETSNDLEALTQTVTGSFAYFPAAPPALPASTVSLFEFDREISLTFDPILSPWAEMKTVPAVPVSDQILFAESHPPFAQIRFLGFQGGRDYDLPIMLYEPRTAQVMVFQTADFGGFGDDKPQGFQGQLQALTELLETGVDPARCTEPFVGEGALPFLPWVNSRQAFCAQPQRIEFSGGAGIRYLTHYSQGPDPVLDRLVFYTFQGITHDGQFYVAAFFPVGTGVFPRDSSTCSQCGDPDQDPFAEWMTVLRELLVQLNAQPEDAFAPSLTLLDDVIRSIRITP
jgi:hypothetical protein